MSLFRLLRRPAGPRSRGQSSVEVMIAMALLAIISQSVLLVVRTTSRQNVANRDRLLAMEKAVQMLEELRSVVMDETAQVTVLDQPCYNDGRDASGNPVLKYTLTTRLDITQPGGVAQPDYQTGVAPLSGNPIRGTGYEYVRNTEIVNYTTANGTIIDPNMRKVWVRVWAAKQNPGATANSTPTAQNVGQPLAQVYGMVHSLGSANQPGQVLDMYLLALESVPGWWSRTSELIPLFSSALVSLQARNPGLYIRPHWVNRMSFGRDFEYTPEYNNAVNASTSGSFKKTYVYPGLITYDDGPDDFYLLSQFSGRLNVDGVLTNTNQAQGGPGAPFNNSLGYPIADQFNQATRLGDEERIYQALCQIASNNNMPNPQMSWRQIQERMNNPNHPDFPNYINSILVNLHGEMVPAVPLRNYSDAAKDPEYYWNTVRYDPLGNPLTPRAFRAVTHAERLAYSETPSGPVPSTVTLRVYAWDMNPPADPITPALENDILNDVTLFIPGATAEDNLSKIWRLKGNSHNSYGWVSQTASNWNNGVDGNGNPVFFDGPTLAGSTWVADDYTPANRGQGLRIHLQGVTPTARLYYGPPN